MNFEWLIESLRKSVRLIVGLGKIDKSSKEKSGIEADISLLGDEKHSAIRVLQHYGFASVPVKGYDVLALFIGGSRDNGVAVASQGKASDIPALDEGEVAMFSKFGQSMVLKKDGSVVVVAKSGKDIVFESRVVVKSDIVCKNNIETSGNVSVSGDVLTSGKVQSVGDVMAGGVIINDEYVDALAIHLKTHVHPTAAVGSPSPPTIGT